eukprot:497380_1
MDPNGRPLDHAQFKARLSMSNSKHSTISTLTDQALIAFEIEHERNRLREELNRLQSAQNDAERCLEILSFMSSHMDKDPLVHPPTRTHNTTTTTNHHHSNHRPQYEPHTHTTHHDAAMSHTIPATLEFLPSNTIIRLANKQVRKISAIRVGDKILSLCINSYPNSHNHTHNTTKNGKSRNSSYLPKPVKKRPSQTNGNLNSLSRAKSMHASNATASSRPSLQQNGGANGHHTSHAKRARSHTKPNIPIPFMLPPAPTPQTLNINENNTTISIGRDSLPRKSMPHLPYHNHHHHHHDKTDPNKQSPNLIHQSVTQAVNDSLVLSPGNNSNKVRSKSFVSPSILYHEEAHHESHTDYNSARKSMQHTSFTQIPGPRPPHTQHNKLNRNRLSYSPNMMQKKARSQNSSPRYSQSHQQQHQSNKKKARFSTNDANIQRSLRRSKNNNYLESVGVIKVIEHTIYQMIEINTENDFKIRCTPTHLFWICGKGWGCFDSKKRVIMEKQQAAIIHKQNDRKKVKMSYIVHELQKGEQLLSVGGNKYRISHVNLIKKPKGIQVYGIVVNKNECFFDNDLLVKNSIS